AAPHAARGEPVSEARGPLGQVVKAQDFVATIGMGYADGNPPGPRIAVDALVSDVQRLAVAVEERPQRRGRKVAVGVSVGRVVREPGHGSPGPLGKAPCM